MMIKRTVLALLLFSMPLSQSAGAQEKNNDIPFSMVRTQDAREVTNFKLTEEFLTKMEKTQQELLQLPVEPDPPGTGDDDTIEGLTASIEGRPRLMELLKKNGITANGYVVGSMALSASLAAAMAENEDQFFDESRTVTVENLAFGKKYADRIRTLLGG